MEFSVVEVGYDRDQVNSCLTDLRERFVRLAGWADAVIGTSEELAPVRKEIARLRELLSVTSTGAAATDRRRAEEEAAEILARARRELAAAKEEARQVRDRVYAEALQARRDFEAALYARRLREEQVDRILNEAAMVCAPVDDSTSSAVPGSRMTAEAAAIDGGQPGRSAAPVQ